MSEISRTRTILLAITVGLGYISWGLLISLQPPFYPSEAEKKGATPSQYGFVFGIFNMAAFLFAPIFGRYGTFLGPKLLYNTGALTQAAVGILFGFLDYVQDTAAFLGISYTLRFIGGVADAAVFGAVLSILMKLYPNHVAQIMSWTEMFYGLGFMMGPALGSALYGIGGFSFPFFTVGAISMVGAIALVIVVPKVKAVLRDKTDGGKSLTFLGLAKSPLIFLPFLDNFTCFCGNGMIESMLEPHLKNSAGATQMQVGLTFLIQGAVYMVTTPIAGNICDRIRYPTIVSITGNCLMLIAFMLIGPVPFLPLAPTTGLIQGSIAICGLGYGMVFVSTFGRSQGAAIRHGYNDDLDTYLIISGMWSCSFFLGNFVGPTVAGVMVDYFGFRNTTLLFFSMYLTILLVDIFELLYNIKYVIIPEKKGYTPIEEKQSENFSEQIK